MAAGYENKLLFHLRQICTRPGMYAGTFEDFDMQHLHLFISGYEQALYEAHQPSQIKEFDRWIYALNPQWQEWGSTYWGTNILRDCQGDMAKALHRIIDYIDRFLNENKEGVR